MIIKTTTSDITKYIKISCMCQSELYIQIYIMTEHFIGQKTHKHKKRNNKSCNCI